MAANDKRLSSSKSNNYDSFSDSSSDESSAGPNEIIRANDAAAAIQPFMYEPRVSRSSGSSTDDDDENQFIPDPGQDIAQPQGADRSGDMFWCLCGNCQLMPTERESFCCREQWDHLREKLNLSEEQNCVTECGNFENVCVNDVVVCLALLMICQFYHNPVPDNPAPNKSMRLAAYRQFILWIYDRLGKHNRQVIPACVVAKIR
ncbi:uncharacterized protein LOC141911549 [Tubulanus polymorphus]|uniref:uncharacterized protein LOC141911549 n=1 Tax=Tubulanus polymorphus TaxID=672921 RepID=UPI003DA4AB86